MFQDHIRPLRRAALAILAGLLVSCGNENPFREGAVSSPPPLLRISAASAQREIGSIIAIVRGDRIADSLVFDLFWDGLSKTYSGSLRLPAAGAEWSVTLLVRDLQGRKMGQTTVALKASDTRLTVDLDADNAFPRVAVSDDTTVSLNDTVRIHAAASDTFGGRLVLQGWDFSGGPGLQAGSLDTFWVATEVTLPLQPRLLIYRALDDDSNRTADTMQVTVIQDSPVADAGRDTTVSVNDTVLLQGSASQQYGSVAEWAWSLAGGAFRAGSRDTVAVMAAVPVDLLNILRVMDDDSNVVTDTMVIHVVLDEPQVVLGPSRSVSVRDTLRLHASVTQGFGRIVLYEWDFRGDGFFRVGPADTFFITDTLPSTQSRCVVRVTDDDGNRGQDTLFYDNLRDAPKINFSADTLCVEMSATIRLNPVVFDTYGRIVRFEWSLDRASFFEVSRLDTALVMPDSFVPFMTFSARVTDDDGNWSVDSIIVKIGDWGGWYNISSGRARQPRLAEEGGLPVVAYLQGDSLAPVIHVKRLAGTSWVEDMFPPAGLKVAAIDLKPWRSGLLLACSGALPANAAVRRLKIYSGTLGAWTLQHDTLFTADTFSMAMINGDPCIAYARPGVGACVERFDGSIWIPAGAQPVSDTTCGKVVLGAAGNVPYVAYEDEGFGSGLTLKRYSGTAWEYYPERGYAGPSVTRMEICDWAGQPALGYWMDNSGTLAISLSKNDGTRWIEPGDFNASIPVQYFTVAPWRGSMFLVSGQYGNTTVHWLYQSKWRLLGRALPDGYWTDVVAGTVKDLPCFVYLDGQRDESVSVRFLR